MMDKGTRVDKILQGAILVREREICEDTEMKWNTEEDSMIGYIYIFPLPLIFHMYPSIQ